MGDIMGIFHTIKKSIFSVSFEDKLMKTINSPIFIKDFSKESENIISLNKLLNSTIDVETKRKIENELNLQKYVQDSLSKVYFELKNSPVPFYGLCNIRLEQGDANSDIDFLMVTNQFCCIINCKSHQGNIEIDSQGSFSRWVKKGEKSIKEGMYSPVEENRRTELVLKGIMNNLGLEKLPIRSLTVFTNPKATLNFKGSSEDFSDKVIKVDLLNTKLRAMTLEIAPAVYDEIKAKGVVEILKGLDTSVKMDYSTKFKSNHSSENILKVEPELGGTTFKSKKCDEEMLVNALKAYRTSIATSNKIPPYYIFNNEEMGKIVEVMPKNKQEFISIKGFGEVKFEKYGEDILNIIKGVTD